jgi:hypothetical protein
VVRRQFNHLPDPVLTQSASRRLPPVQDRPPAARLVSPWGFALRLYLLALWDAQIHTEAGRRPDNRLPLIGRGRVGWSDLLALPSSGPGRGGNGIRRRPGRREGVRYERFQLNDEGGGQGGFTLPYRVPVLGEAGTYALPAELITQGWIHLLTDAELLMLMMVADQHVVQGRERVQIPADIRRHCYSIGYDCYESNLVLERLGLLEVIEQARHADGKIVEFSGRTQPHTLALLPAGFARRAPLAFEQALTELHAGGGHRARGFDGVSLAGVTQEPRRSRVPRSAGQAARDRARRSTSARMQE